MFLDDDERTSPVPKLGPGQFFGEMSLLTGEKRSATICAVRETSLLVLNQDSLSYLLHENQELAKVLSDALAERSEANLSLKAKQEDHRQKLDKRTEKDLLAQQQRSTLFLERIRRFFRLG